jgi:hypothetical protein
MEERRSPPLYLVSCQGAGAEMRDLTPPSHPTTRATTGYRPRGKEKDKKKRKRAVSGEKFVEKHFKSPRAGITLRHGAGLFFLDDSRFEKDKVLII